MSRVTVIRLGAFRRAGFDPYSPSVESKARRGASGSGGGGAVGIGARHKQNGAMARRRRARFEVRPPDDGGRRRPGPHWRADGAPKAAYLTQGEALSVAEERRRETGVELGVYLCDHCGGWHMGSRESERR